MYPRLLIVRSEYIRRKEIAGNLFEAILLGEWEGTGTNTMHFQRKSIKRDIYSNSKACNLEGKIF